MPYKNQNYHEEKDNDVYGERYAEDYRDQSYMTKKVHDIASHGSEYLEGLRRSVEAYEELLINCRAMNFTNNGRPTPVQNNLPPNAYQFGIQPSFVNQFSNQPPNANQFSNQPPNANQFSNQPPTANQFSNQPPNANQFSNQPPNTNQFSNQPPNANQFSNQPSNANFGNQPQNQLVSQVPITTRALIPGFRRLTSITTPMFQPSPQQCERATQAREHVRRLAELVVWATRELEDRAYAKKYDGHHDDDDEEEDEEEAELLLKLAWFLDRLAYLTGFEPNPKKYITTPPPRTTTTTPQPGSLALVPIPQPVTQFYINCLKNSSSPLPAVERCTFPNPMPEELIRLFNITTPTTSTTLPPDDMGVLPQNTQRPAASMLSEVLLPAETSKVTAVKSIKKRSLTDNPMLYFMKYYAKHKVWHNDNTDLGNGKNSNDYHATKYLGNDAFNVNNELIESDKKKVKRSVKKFEHLRLPEDPFQNISYVVKHKTQKSVNYVKNDGEALKMKAIFDKMRKSDGLIAKNSLKNLQRTLKNVQKRSIDFTKVLPLNSVENSKNTKTYLIGKFRPDKGYYKKVHKRSVDYAKKVLPEKSRDPQGDISYYVKNKPGTNFNADPVQTAQARAALERMFQNPNIEIVRRYGSRGPVYANVILEGALLTFGDFGP
ncbi:uncharacterized protein LOC113225854 isoform X1 [Hyposmocoma kahamanoa]|uniref:uncharacterized protein LOC113225854 isoform X1 n=1 Tax=Hyposmocoma kahamanoa TaxID=1477025 RepID=UPI000E6D5C93|nr:uncharacterized protein LOC113225854 isoform X1 [Hyposmocoma kahamanoa]